MVCLKRGVLLSVILGCMNLFWVDANAGGICKRTGLLNDILQMPDSIRRVDLLKPAYHDAALKRIELYLAEMMYNMLAEGENEDAGPALEYFEQLLERPLLINKATRGDLERLLLLSDFQITSLLSYREEHGDILSGTELSLLNGFSEELVELLRCFILFEQSGGGKKSSGYFLKDCYSSLLWKGSRVLEREEWYMPIKEEDLKKKPDSRYLGTPYYMQLKYKCEYLDKIQVGFTLENDAGERSLSPEKIPMGDFFSFHTAFKGVKIGKWSTDFIVGDFSARFGQGLTLWNSFSLSAVGDPQGFYKRGAAILPYTSSDENNFFRGAAVLSRREWGGMSSRRGKGDDVTKVKQGGKNELEIAAMFSHHAVDAVVKGDVYTSVLTGGLHHTKSTYAHRKAMYETVAGVNALARFSRVKIGISWATYGYDKENGRKIQEYNKFQMYNGIWGNFGANFYTVAGRWRVFGEMAVDYGGSLAVLSGAIFNIGTCEVGMLARSYSKSYIAPHANAYSTISGCYNQTGAAVNIGYPVSRLLKLSANLDFAHYPWQRFNVPEASSFFKGFVKLEYAGERLHGYVRFADSYSSDKFYHKTGFRTLVGWEVFKNVMVKVRGEVVGVGKSVVVHENADFKPGKQGRLQRLGSTGYDVAADLDYKLRNKRWRIQLRGAYFSCSNWDTRLYLYEPDLPGAYVSQLLYGRGFKGYVLMQVKPWYWAEAYMKLETIRYLKGGGESDLSAPRSKMKLGLKIRF